MPNFRLNDKRVETVMVGDTHSITFLGPEGPRVLSTPKMIGFMERTCRDLVLEMLDHGFDTVGTHVNVWHKTAAAMGSTVVFSAQLTDVIFDDEKRPRRVEFQVRAMQGDKVIGEGTHQRAIVNVRRFKEKVTG